MSRSSLNGATPPSGAEFHRPDRLLSPLSWTYLMELDPAVKAVRAETKARDNLCDWMAALGDLLDRFNLEFLSEATTRFLLFHNHLRHASIVGPQCV